MLQIRGELDLLQKPLGPQHRGELRMQDLDRHVAAMPDVLGEIHGRHTALAELADQAVTIGESTGKPGVDRGHRPCNNRCFRKEESRIGRSASAGQTGRRAESAMIRWLYAGVLSLRAATPFAAQSRAVPREDGQGTMPGRDYAATRYSPLAQLTPANVGRLRPVWNFSTGVTRG